MKEGKWCLTQENRQSARYTIEGLFYANACRSGLICDISRSGLAFQYIDRKHWPTDSGFLDIVNDEAGFFLGGLAYKVVSDEKVKSGSDTAQFIKRMSLAFQDLSVEQEERIDFLLHTFSRSRQKNKG